MKKICLFLLLVLLPVSVLAAPVVNRSVGGILSILEGGTIGQYLIGNGSGDAPTWVTVIPGSGDVTGPASTVADNFASFNGVTGKLIKDSGSKASDFATALGADDNYVTDAEKIVIGNTSGTNTGDQIIPTSVDSLGPSQSGNGGKYLTTNGTNAFWGVVAGGTDIYWTGTATNLVAETGRTSLGLGTAAIRAAEDTLTDGSNLPDGAAIKAYGDANWSGGGGTVGTTGTPVANDFARFTDGNTIEGLDYAETRSALGLTQYTDEMAQDAVGGIFMDTVEIDLTYADMTPSIFASIKLASIDETKLDASVNASLDLADSAMQSGDIPTSVDDLGPSQTGNNGKYLTTNGTNAFWAAVSGSMVYPGVGIPLSTGSAWSTSIANNSANWNTAYGWGNHSGLYRPVAWVPSWSDITSKPTTFAPIIGTGAGDAVAGNDARLTNARTPTSHTHGNISNDGKVGTASNLMLKTTTGGTVTTLAAGIPGQFLSYNGLWATPAGSGDMLAANNLSDLANDSISRANLGVAIGTDVLAYRTFGTAANSAVGDFAAALGGNDNYVTDDQLVVIGNTSNTNSGDQTAGDFSHNSLSGLNDGTDYEHITQAQKNALHAIVTSIDNLGPSQTGNNGKYLTTNGTNAFWATLSSGTVTGTGTDNYVTKWNLAGSGIENSLLYSNSTGVGIGTTNPVNALDLGQGTNGRGIAWGGPDGTYNYANIWTSLGAADLVLATGMKAKTVGGAGFLSSYGGNIGRAAIQINAFTGTGGSIHFFTDADAIESIDTILTPTERMTIDYAGKVTVAGDFISNTRDQYYYTPTSTNLGTICAALNSSNAEATVWLRHTTGTATPTYYTISTMTLDPTIKLKIDPGAQLTISGTLTVKGKIDAGRHKIVNSGTLRFTYNTRQNEVYPEWWGAITQDNVDDTIAIQAALDSGIRNVVLGIGRYQISSVLNITVDGTSLTGKASTSVNYPEIYQKTPSSKIISINGKDYVTIANLSLIYEESYTSLTSGAVAIYAPSVTGNSEKCVIDNIFITGCYIGIDLRGTATTHYTSEYNISNVYINQYVYSAIRLYYAQNIYVRNFSFNGSSYTASGLGGAIRLENYVFACMFMDGLTAVSAYSMISDAASSAYNQCASSCRFTNVLFDSGKFGTVLNNMNECTFYNCWWSNDPSGASSVSNGITLDDTKDVRFIGCTIFNVGASGISASSSTKGLVVSGCSIQSVGKGTATSGAYIYIAAGADRFIITNNTMTENASFAGSSATYGVQVGAGSDHYIIKDNLITSYSTGGVSAATSATRIVSDNISW